MQIMLSSETLEAILIAATNMAVADSNHSNADDMDIRGQVVAHFMFLRQLMTEAIEAEHFEFDNDPPPYDKIQNNRFLRAKWDDPNG